MALRFVVRIKEVPTGRIATCGYISTPADFSITSAIALRKGLAALHSSDLATM